MTQVPELRLEVARVVHRASENESTFEGRENLVCEGGQIDGRGRRVQFGGLLELGSSRLRHCRMEAVMMSEPPSPASWRS